MKNKDVFSLSAMMRRRTRRTGTDLDSSSGSFNNSDLIDQTRCQQGSTASDGLNPLPQPDDHTLSMRINRTVAVITPFLMRASQFDRLRGVMSVIAESDYEVRLFTVEAISQRHKILQRVLRQGFDGLLIFLIDPTEANIHCIHQENLPTVLVEADHPALPSIVVDDVAAAQTSVHYLIELGHRKIAYVSEDNNRFDLPYRRYHYQGYCQALESAGLPLTPDYYCQGWDHREQGRQMALDLLSLPDPPTAIVADSDELAFDVLEAAQDLNLDVPRHLSVIGYGDTEVAHFTQLTTVRRHLFEMGVQGAKQLLAMIEQPDPPPTLFRLPAELVIRRTTASPFDLP